MSNNWNKELIGNKSYFFVILIHSNIIAKNRNCKKTRQGLQVEEMAEAYDFLIKLLLIGDSCVGKSCTLLGVILGLHYYRVLEEFFSRKK
jgi:Mg2+/Co2+ transporter CorB